MTKDRTSDTCLETEIESVYEERESEALRRWKWATETGEIPEM